MSKESWVILGDALASVVTIAVGIWVLPEYREFSLAVFGLLQTAAGLLIVEFRSQRKAEQIRGEIVAEIEARLRR